MTEPKTSLRQAKKEESNLESFLRIAGYEKGKPTRFVSIEELKEQNRYLIFNNGLAQNIKLSKSFPISRFVIHGILATMNNK
jgi:hypothetical protein